MNRKLVLFALVCAVVAFQARAITYIVPPDRELVARADLIFVGTVTRQHCELNSAGGAFTVVSLSIEKTLKGDVAAGDEIQLFEPGGEVGTHKTVVFGSPRLLDGQRYLIFTDFDGEYRRTSAGLGLGVFTLRGAEDGQLLAVRDSEIYGLDSESLAEHVEMARVAPSFERYIESVVAGRGRLTGDYFVESQATASAQNVTTSSTFTMASYLGYAGDVVRWSSPTYTFKTNGNQPPQDAATSASTASTGVSRWNSAGGSSVHISVSGTTSSTTGLSSPDGQNTILFNDPANEFPQLTGLAGGVGGVNAQGSAQPLPDGSGSASSPTEVDIVLAKNFSPISCLSLILTHESGHTLGFRHADKNSSEGPCALPLDCSSGQSVMNANPSCSLSSLQPWETRAVATVYGSGCASPTINTDPASTSISSGNSTGLSVVATGISPLTYQWYIGAKSDTSSPINGQTSSSITVSPTSTTSYWVQVTNPCGSTDSNAATVTVTGGGCTAAAVGTQPTGSTITQGSQATLSVVATGTSPFTYQWYVGSPGDTSSPVGGGTTASIQVSPSSTTSYWVKVTNSCNATGANSNAATVTVNPVSCTAPQVTTDPTGSTITFGNSAQLSVVASGTGPLSYQWYTGAKSNTGSPVFNGTTATINVNPQSTTTYWVRVTGACAPPADSNTATVTVNCLAPQVSVSPSSRTITQGSSTFFSATASGGPNLTLQWYVGVSGDTSNPIAGQTSSTLTVSPTTSTSYRSEERRVGKECRSRWSPYH